MIELIKSPETRNRSRLCRRRNPYDKKSSFKFNPRFSVMFNPRSSRPSDDVLLALIKLIERMFRILSKGYLGLK